MDMEDLNNFRPITNLTFLSKVIERTANCQSRHYLKVSNLYPKLQAAYQLFYSTETALLRVRNDILRALDNKKEVILVLLDLSAAFGTIDHEILVNRLRTQFGSTGKVFRSVVHFTAIVNLEQCISDIQTFLLVNKLSCNHKKTEVVHFHS